MDAVNNLRRRKVDFYSNCIQLGHGIVSGNGAPVQCLNEDQMLFIGIIYGRFDFKIVNTRWSETVSPRIPCCKPDESIQGHRNINQHHIVCMQ